MGLIVAIVLCAIGVERGVHYARQSKLAATAPLIRVRTATVTSGPVVRTLRLTGSTGAEKYSSLISPQLRGARGTGGRDGSLRNAGGGGGSQVIQSNAGGGGGGMGGGSGSSSSSTSSSSSATSTTSVASTNGQNTGSGSAAFRSATSRVGSTRTTAPSSTSRVTTTTPSTTSTNTATSSTAIAGTPGNGGQGGGGGGGGEFNLVLQDAAKPGSHVKKGDIVAEFDRQNMLLRLDDYRASVAQIEASVRKLEAELKVTKQSHTQSIENALAALEKARLDMKTVPVLGAIDAERVRLAAEEAEASYKQLLAEVKFVEIGQQSQLKNAELEFQQAQVELKRSEANADRMLLKAPINGLVVMQNTNRGTELGQIQPGDQLFPGMMFMQIVDLSSMIINATVNQADVESLRLGQKASVRFDAYPDMEVPAHIAAIGAMTRAGGQRASYVKDIPVILRIDRMDARIIPDLSVSIDVHLGSEENATVAPLSAVFRDSSDAAPFVYVKNGEGWERRQIELGVIGNIYASVRSGLKPGEVVAEEVPPLDPNKERS